MHDRSEHEEESPVCVAAIESAGQAVGLLEANKSLIGDFAE